MATTVELDRLEELHRKVDALAAQVEFLAGEARLQAVRRQEWNEFKDDVGPVAQEAYRIAVEQLAEIEDYVQAEDLLRLLKRLARNTHNLEKLLAQMESLSELVEDGLPLGKDVFMGMLARLDEAERRGYFDFLGTSLEVVDRVVTSFTEDDVRQLADNIVLILETVKEMTQPEVMLMLRRTALTVRSEDQAPPSVLGLLRQFRDPEVKRGVARMLTMLRSMGGSRTPPPPQITVTTPTKTTTSP